MTHFIVYHDGTKTYMDLSECMVLAIDEYNQPALDALEAADFNKAIKLADEVMTTKELQLLMEDAT